MAAVLLGCGIGPARASAGSPSTRTVSFQLDLSHVQPGDQFRLAADSNGGFHADIGPAVLLTPADACVTLSVAPFITCTGNNVLTYRVTTVQELEGQGEAISLFTAGGLHTIVSWGARLDCTWTAPGTGGSLMIAGTCNITFPTQAAGTTGTLSGQQDVCLFCVNQQQLGAIVHVYANW